MRRPNGNAIMARARYGDRSKLPIDSDAPNGVQDDYVT